MRNGLVVDSDGKQPWYLNGQYHRTDGPAVIWSNGLEITVPVD